MKKAPYDMGYRLTSFDAMCSGTDLEIFIIGAALIDRALVNALTTKLPNSDEMNVFEVGHALSDYSHRLEVCRALGLIDSELWEDMKSVGKMRNEAAHLNTGGSLSLSDQSFADRIASLHEVKSLGGCPELLQEDRPIKQRTGVLYEGPRSQLLWSLTEILCKLDKLASIPSGKLPPQRYRVGDRVKIRLTTDAKVLDLEGREEAVGTITDMPGGLVYNVRVDDPPNPSYNTLTYLADEDIVEKL